MSHRGRVLGVGLVVMAAGVLGVLAYRHHDQTGNLPVRVAQIVMLVGFGVMIFEALRRRR